MLKAIINSAKKSWRGEEKLWKVFWLWFVLLYPSSVILGFAGIYFSTKIEKYANPLILILLKSFDILMAVCGFTMVLVYPIILIFSMWRCWANSDLRYVGTLARIFPALFIYIHIWYSMLVYVGSCLFANAALYPTIKVFKIF